METAAVGPGSGSEAHDGPPPLPRGWGELRTDDGRPYYVYYPTGAVQWQRPKPQTDSEGGDLGDERQSPGIERQAASVKVAVATGADAGASGAAVGAEAVRPGAEAVGAGVGGGGGRDAGYPGADELLRGEVRFCIPRCLVFSGCWALLAASFGYAVRVHVLWVLYFVFLWCMLVVFVRSSSPPPSVLCTT